VLISKRLVDARRRQHDLAGVIAHIQRGVL
jgi:hypothetical protein